MIISLHNQGPARAVLDSWKHFCKSDPTEEAKHMAGKRRTSRKVGGGGGGGGGGIDEYQQTGIGLFHQ